MQFQIYFCVTFRPVAYNWKLQKYPQVIISSPRETFLLTKYPHEKNLKPQNTHEKRFWTHQIPTRKNLRPTKRWQEKISGTRNNLKKKIETNEISAWKNFGPTKYPRRYDGTRPMMARDLWNLAECKKLDQKA